MTALAVADPLKAAPAPDDGAVKVTVAPLTGVPALLTVACSAVPNAVLMIALCGVPALAAMTGPEPEEDSAAPFSVTLPLPEEFTQVMASVWPAAVAW